MLVENHPDLEEGLMETSNTPAVSVVLPCLDEEEAIGLCIQKIQHTLANCRINGEIVVCDNGSSDNSVAIASQLGAYVVHEPRRGYGNAYIKGFAHARGKYLIMGDADDTYDFSLIPKFLDLLMNQGYDFVTGSRYLAGGDQNITRLHRYVGNPLLTAFLNLIFGTKFTDVYCGFRAFSRKAYEQMGPVSPGMEFNLEIAINAGLAKLNTVEVPILLGPRKGKSKLRTFRDGWRSLRMLLLYSPNFLFFIPGSLLLALGIVTHLAALMGLVRGDGPSSGGDLGVIATIFSVVGFQILSLGLHAKTYAWGRRLDRGNKALENFYRYFKLETGLILGGGFVFFGGVILMWLLIPRLRPDTGPLLRPVWGSFAATMIIIGFSTIFSSLLISTMSLDKKNRGR